MRFAHELRYDAAPSDVHRMLADPAFRDQVCAAMQATRHEVSVDPAAGDPTGLVVVVDQTQPARGIPSFARRFVGEEIRIVQRETWTGTSGASLAIEIPGKPGRLDGTVSLAGDGAGTLESVTGDVRVKVPLIGGKLESLVADLLRAALQTEERVGRRWLTGQH
jgi:Protein of unknown function (DUF2505)